MTQYINLYYIIITVTHNLFASETTSIIIIIIMPPPLPQSNSTGRSANWYERTPRCYRKLWQIMRTSSKMKRMQTCYSKGTSRTTWLKRVPCVTHHRNSDRKARRSYHRYEPRWHHRRERASAAQRKYRFDQIDLTTSRCRREKNNQGKQPASRGIEREGAAPCKAHANPWRGTAPEHSAYGDTREATIRCIAGPPCRARN